MSKSMKISKENEFKYIQIGLNVAYFRKMRGYSQEELAELVDISRSYISAIEAPNIVQNVSLEVLFRLAKALEIEPYQLLEFRE